MDKSESRLEGRKKIKIQPDDDRSHLLEPERFTRHDERSNWFNTIWKEYTVHSPQDEGGVYWEN